MRMKKKAGFALLAASALVLSACSGGDSNGDASASGSADGNGGAADLPASDYNEVARDQLTEGGTLRMTVGSLPTNWNAMQVDGNTVDNNTIYGFIAPVNFYYDETGTPDVNPNFVTEMSQADADGGKMTTTLKLNPDAVWNDGTPITVADYQATWQACNGETEGFLCASTDGWTEIESIEAGADEFEVVTTWKVAYPDWTANFSTVMPAEGVKDADTFNEGWVKFDNARDLLAGPFVIDSVNEAQGSITLKRNENWWGDTAILDTVTFSALEPEAAAQAFANNEIDVVDGITSASIYETVNGRQDGEVKMSTSVQWRHFTFNSRAESVSDVEFRRAIQKGIDTNDIAASDLAGLPVADMNMHLGNHFFMPNQDQYEDHSVEFDPEGAKADLEALGYTMNDSTGFYELDGKTAGFKYLRITGVPASENEGIMLQQQMADIGVEVTFTDSTSADFFNYVIGGEYEVTSFAWQGTPYPMANVGQIYGKPFDESGNLVNSNFTGLEVPEIDALIPQIAAETDPDKRAELTNEADQLVWDNVMVLPLYYRASMVAIPQNLANYGATSMQTFPVENIGFSN